MTSGAFDAKDWTERVAAALGALAKVQESYLHAYWQHHPREQVVVDGRDETPFPLDDLRMVYAGARYRQAFGREAEYEPLRKVLDPVRYALLAHPKLERVAVSGRSIGENDFSLKMVSSDKSTSAGELIAGLMARTADRTGEDFRAAVRELNAFLSPVGDEDAARVLGDLDEGCDALLFYGVSVNERIDVEDGMQILPFEELRRFVEQEFVKELAPRGAGFHEWRGVGAVIAPFRWRPVFRRRGSVNEPPRSPPERFLPDAGTFLDLLAVNHEAPVLPLASISGCIDRMAGRLFGVGSQGPGFYQKWAADGLDGYDECPVLRPAAFQEAREAFRDRASARFQRLAPIVGQLAVALGRDGRLARNDKVVDVAIALEGMYELPRWKKQRRLEGRVSGFLGADTEEGPRIKENIRMLYETRSDIVHGGSGEVSPLRKDAAFVAGFELARRSLFKLLSEGVPDNWDEVAVQGE